MKKNILFLFLLVLLLPAYAEISFENPDLNSRDELLYTVNYKAEGSWSYKSVFHSVLAEEDIQKSEKTILSCFPEQMEIISLKGKKILQIRNRFGTARYYPATDSFSWINQNSSIPLFASKTNPLAVNADGKWFCYLHKTGTATGSLILENSDTGKTIELGSDLLLSSKVPVKWSKNGDMLLYEKHGSVYFCSPDAMNRGVEVEEKYRKVGRGTINSVEWASEKHLVYIDDYIVYRINTRELYTTGLYAGIIGQGSAIGRLPFQFNSKHDDFSVSPDTTGLIVAQDGKNFTYFRTLYASCDYMDILYSKPYTDSNASLADYQVIWDKKGEPVLWLEKMPFDSVKLHGNVIKLGETAKNVLEIEDSGVPVISPDGGRVAFFAGSTLFIYDINTWNRVAQISGEKIINVVWENAASLFIGGEQTVRRWTIGSDKADTITLSSAENVFWERSTDTIVAETSGKKRYAFNWKKGKWIPTGFDKPVSFNAQNEKYRAYLGNSKNTLFKNALYIRTLSSKAVTKALHSVSIKKLPEKQKVALIFDAYDNADGLPRIISTLSRFNLPGTFFINGEFIRRYPSQVKQIALNGYECGNMFFTPTDFSDSTFIVDSNFIVRGLARNEDDFFKCTGKELSLYWHAPFYESTPGIEKAGKDAGYEYISSPHIHSDYITLKQLEEGKTYLPPEKLIAEYVSLVKATRGGIIPVTVGVSQADLSENLWEHIDLLINTLLDENFELVPVSVL